MTQADALTGEGTVVEASADAPPQSSPGARRQLRIALAMRGGVSLAVWIGGAVTEIERLRRHDKPENNIYDQLLEINGYNDVIVDVISGASAGGLNGVVYATAQVHGFEMSALRNLWLKLGDIELLARDTTAGGRAMSGKAAGQSLKRGDALRPPSLLRGDEYFYTSVLRALTDELGKTRQDDTRADRLDLLLSATLFEPKTVKTLVNRTTVIEDGRSNALFRFAHGSPTTDLDESPESLKRLGMAARSTSSFPGAFEPARIGIGDQATNTTDQIDFSSIFEVPRTDRDTGLYEVIDGGVLDNIPVAAAIDAVVDAPADGPTERWVCYLHPSPAARAIPADQSTATVAPRLVKTALRTFSTRFNQESLLEDVDQLRLVNDLLARRRRLRNALLSPYETTGYTGVLDDARQEYRGAVLREMLAQFEAHRIRTNLERPDRLRLTGALPFVNSWPPGLQTALGQELLVAQQARVAELEPAQTITVVSEATELLISHARTIENLGDVQQIRLASAVKNTLYELRTQIDTIVHAEAAAWGAAAAGEFGNPETADPLTMTAWVMRVQDETSAAAQTDLALMWDGIVAAATELVAITTGLPQPFALLQSAPGDQVGAVVEALVFLLLPVRLMGRGPWNPLTFVYITGDAPTSLAFDALATSGSLTSKQKLAGNELANFSAFLSATWRANDWMWGRLDAASVLVGQLCGPAVLESAATRQALADLAGVSTDAEDKAIVDAIRDRIQQQIFEDELPTIKSTPASAIDELRPPSDMGIEDYGIGVETLSHLGERRRTRVGMRMAHLVFAALRPAGGTRAAGIVRVGTSILKPLYLVAVFAVLAPARAFLALAIGASAVQVTFWRGEGDFSLNWDWWTRAFLVATAAAAMVAAVRWKRRADPAAVPDDPWMSVAMLIGGGAAIASLIHIFSGAGARYLALGSLNLAIIVLGLTNTVGRWKKGDRGSSTLAIWVLAVVAAALGIFFGWLNPLWDGNQTQWSQVEDLIYILIPAAVAATVIGSSWMRAWAWIAAAGMSVALGFGTLSITEHRGRNPLGIDTRLWLWIAAAALILIYLSDVAKMWTSLHFGDGESKSSLLPGVVTWVGLLVAATYVATTRDVTVSMGVWAAVAVVCASYANTALATHLPVFQRPEPLEI